MLGGLGQPCMCLQRIFPDRTSSGFLIAIASSQVHCEGSCRSPTHHMLSILLGLAGGFLSWISFATNQTASVLGRELPRRQS